MRLESLQNEPLPADNNGDPCPAPVIDTRVPTWKRELMRKRSTIVTHRLKQSGGGLVAAMAAVFDPRIRTELTSQQFQITAIKDARLGCPGFNGASRSRRDNEVTTHQHEVNSYCSAQQQTKPEHTEATEQPTNFEAAPPMTMSSFKSAEEFQYGPGIVQRLKSRFLSSEQEPILLRRTGPLKRTASLENWLDCDPSSSVTDGVFKAVPVANPEAPKPRPSSLILQKTKSVEILTYTGPPRPKLTPSPSLNTPLTPAATPLAFTAFAKEDLVIIEKNERQETPPQESPVEKKALPPPAAAPPIPKQRRIPPLPARSYSANSNELPAPDTVRNVKSLFESQQSVKTSAGRNFSTSNRIASTWGSNPQKENLNVQTLNEENRTKQPATSLHQFKPLTSTGPLKVLQRTNAVQEDSDPADTCGNHAESPRIVTSDGKQISPAALDNIRKEGVSLKFNFSGQQKQVGIIRPLPTAEKITIPNTNNIPLPKVEKVAVPKDQKATIPKATEVKQPEPKKEPPTETVLLPVAKPTAPAATPAATTATPKPVAVTPNNPKSQQKENSTTSATKARKWHQDTSATTIVFNFKERKETPDYITNEGGHQTRNGVVLYMDPASESSDHPDNLGGSLSSPKQPPPCRVQFEGANIIINGKSSIRSKSKSKKLKISFKDDLTKVFEYPSESALTEMMAEEKETTATATPAVLSNGSTASSFAGYTPKVNIQDTFELGVRRIVSAPLVLPTTPPPPPPAEEFALPTQEGAAWSAENSADLLF